jgi:mandelate racemase
MPDPSRPVIQSVRARAVRVPMPEPHRTASGVITESPLVLVDVATDAGVTGHGLLFTYTTAALRPVADLVHNLAPLVQGQPLAPAEVFDQLSAKCRLLGTQGLVGMAIAGIDMALWDAQARRHGVSLARLLGGIEKPIRVYGAVGYDGPDGAARTAAAWKARGVHAVKAKIGYPDVRTDVDVLRAIRDAAGPDVAIMADYNQSLTPSEAVVRLRALAPLDPAWIEEPTLAHDFTGHAFIRRETTIPIQCGENWWGPLDLRHAIDAGAADFVMPEAMKIGGVTGWRRAAALAEAAGLPISSHLWPEISAQLLSTTPLAHWLEYADWWNPILSTPLVVEDGIARPSTVPGSGLAWNEDVVRDCLVA